MSIYDVSGIDPPDPKEVLKDDKPDSYGVASRGNNKWQIRNTRAVNEHAAKMIVRYGMDYEAAVSAMLPDEAPEVHVKMLAKVLEQRPQIQRFKQDYLGKLGFGPDAEAMFKATLSEVALDKNHKQWAPAIKIVGEYYGWSKNADQGDKPVTLVLKGFEKDLETLFDGAVPQADAMPRKRPIIETASDEENDIVQ